MKTIGILLATLALPCVVSAQNVTVRVPRHFVTPASDEARETFNAGRQLYDEDNFAEAERKFREVIQKFPRHPIADRADYYLIRTLTQLGKHRFLENTTRSTRSRHMSHFCHRDGKFEKVGHLAALSAMTDAAGRCTS